jgi:4-amino-4-deoxy-L-arabinose transferase-like glycosyltransferase
MSSRGKRWLIGLAWAAAWLRFGPLFDAGLAADEALFATWARLVATLSDPLLQGQLVDKPPLLFYLQAVAYPLLGPGEAAARLPNLAASILTVPLTGLLAWRLYRHELVAVLAAGFVAFSPLAIQFSTTALTDPLLAFWIVLALVLVTGRARGRHSLAAGLVFGLATATKLQAWLGLPLVVALASLNLWPRRAWRAWLLGLLLALLAVIVWQTARPDQPSLWSAQWASYGGLRPASSWELWLRLEAWGAAWGTLISSPILGFAILLAAPPFLALLIADRDRDSALDQALVIYLAAYFVVHWLAAVPVWDRYLLPTAAIVGIVLTRLGWRLAHFARPAVPALIADRLTSSRILWLLPAGLLLFQAPSALEARQGRLPIGDRTAADAAIPRLAAALDDSPYGTVLYDHWASWQWRFYLLDRRVYVSWFAGPAELAGDLRVFGRDGPPRYLALPAGDGGRPVARAVREAGFTLEPVGPAARSDGEMGLYRLVPE